MSTNIKLFPIVCFALSLCSCNVKKTNSVVIPKITSLPPKTNPQSTLMSDSVIKPYNLDYYLFLDDCIYIDLRYPKEFFSEGHVAGFINIPFYGYIADLPSPKSSKSLFEMKTVENTYLGGVGSFVPRYEGSVEWLTDSFPKDKNIVVLSTAGVEGAYFLNLLVQYGYDSSKLYNAGSFSNGMGEDIAYRLYDGAKYLVPPFELYDTSITYDTNLE